MLLLYIGFLAYITFYKKKTFLKLHGSIVSKGSCKVVWFDLNHTNTCSNEVKLSSQTSLSQLEQAYILTFSRLAGVFWVLVNIMIEFVFPIVIFGKMKQLKMHVNFVWRFVQFLGWLCYSKKICQLQSIFATK
jgi:hypothetical protein